MKSFYLICLILFGLVVFPGHSTAKAIVVVTFLDDESSTQQSAEQDSDAKLEYICKIPRGLASNVRLMQKTGKEKSFNLHKLYRDYYKLGWFGTVNYFAQTGRLDYRSGVICNWKCQYDALQIGIADVSAEIRRYRLVHGEENTKKMIQEFYQNNQKEFDRLFPDSPEFSQ